MTQMSPVIKTNKIESQTLMSFPDAMAEVILGKKISRVDWNNTEEFGILKDGQLQIHTKGKFHSWLVSDGDMLSQDWIVLNESN
jgi:hypothetical protein